MTQTEEFVVIGKLVGVYGVRGWVKVFSHTAPKENIFEYAPWYLKINGRWQSVKVLTGRVQGKGLVAHIESYNDREQVQSIMGAEIAIHRDQLPTLAKDEYYWADLIGLSVVTRDGVALGKVDHLFSTGANDVVVVKGEREHLVPFVQGQYVLEIDLAAGVMQVDWDPEF